MDLWCSHCKRRRIFSHLNIYFWATHLIGLYQVAIGAHGIDKIGPSSKGPIISISCWQGPGQGVRCQGQVGLTHNRHDQF